MSETTTAPAVTAGQPLLDPVPATERPSIGPIADIVPQVRRIVVLRGGALGDLLYAVPALYALAAAYPAAEITLLGSALHADLLRGRPGPVDEVEVLPVTRTDWNQPAQPAEVEFVDRLRTRPVDLAVQLHGGGAWSNPFLRQLNPRVSVGSRAAGAPPLDRNLAYRFYQNEVLRALEVAGLAGAPPVVMEPRVELTPQDVAAADAVLGTVTGPLVVVHPGANDSRRRWPAAAFAEIATHCLDRGATVLIIGGPSDHALVTDLRSRIPAAGDARADRLRTLVGSDMSTLCGVLARAAVLVGNDSGPRHLARAVGTPTVGVFWIGNVISAGPLSRGSDRVLISWQTHCPVCGSDATDERLPRCPHGDSLVSTVPVAAVRGDVDELLGWD
ncbi:glycosyltransferase family 9 protein [Nocardia sp. BSTN01]|uniref:glycosyltransferase family 9 protein n=1 Tax=Nocardia sp. BSTN01 TaxID=2783665 RepID=UPI00188FC038|nr:glycosyltransferase family 9 protein [Nocardia sp. BSTN01]MBF4996215.1 glycosyltransferase family 9 protein [Nocardia sp. BSTN01]